MSMGTPCTSESCPIIPLVAMTSTNSSKSIDPLLSLSHSLMNRWHCAMVTFVCPSTSKANLSSCTSIVPLLSMSMSSKHSWNSAMGLRACLSRLSAASCAAIMRSERRVLAYVSMLESSSKIEDGSTCTADSPDAFGVPPGMERSRELEESPRSLSPFSLLKDAECSSLGLNWELKSIERRRRGDHGRLTFCSHSVTSSGASSSLSLPSVVLGVTEGGMSMVSRGGGPPQGVFSTPVLSVHHKRHKDAKELDPAPSPSVRKSCKHAS
mmetsp:Transcript_31843/g.101447  ORF Transcript_31843/g.101447 Transcript_31843/m.101447 type:complete len:267 (-) Transcript_31843:195-995(-)